MAATNRPRTASNDDFQFVLDSLLKAYKAILEKELKQAESAKALVAASEKNPPTCDDEIELAEGLFKRFFTPEVATRLLPDEGVQVFGTIEQNSWCYRNIICCLIFGWLVCRGPRTYKGFAYYLNRYWRCVRQALGQPVSDPLTLEEKKDFATLVRILAKAYAPSIDGQLKELEYPVDIAGDIESGEINCHTDDDAANSVFERLLSPEGSAALFGAKAYAQHAREPIFRSCRCYCICALEFGCCLGRSRTLLEALGCLEGFFACVRRCFEPLIAEIDAPPACSSLTFVPVCGDLTGVEVTGTAAGGAFTSYTLSYTFGGPIINDAVVYPDCTRPPANPSSSTQVTAGVLGYIDASLLPYGVTEVTVYLDVYGSGGLHLQVNAVFQFEIKAIEINGVAGVPTFVGQDPFSAVPSSIKMLQNSLSPGFEQSIGGGVFVNGSANVLGCGVQMTQYQLALFGPVPGAEPLPSPTPSPTALGGAPLIPPVQFTGAPLYPPSSPTACGSPILEPNVIINGNLVAQWHTVSCTLPHPDIRNLINSGVWSSAPNGRAVIFLEVDEGPTAAPHTPFVTSGHDQVAVWIDNFGVVGQITQVGNVIGCGDLHLKDYVGTTAPVKGIAWDYPIDMLSTQLTPNDNFGAYALSYQKNGGGGQGFVNTDYTPNGAAPGTSPSVRVPNLWQATPPVAPGLLASWDIVTALDGGAPPDPSQPCVPSNAWQLPRGCRCAYVIELSVNDTTWVGNGGDNHTTLALFAINIINDIGT